MEIANIIQELIHKGIIKCEIINLKQLSGGTASQVFLLDLKLHKMVIKINEPVVIEQEACFLNFYKNVESLPKLIYEDDFNRFIVYTFIDGDTNDALINKSEALIELVQNLINHYKVSTINGWGWTDELSNNWQEFLLKRYIDATTVLKSYLKVEDILFIERLIKRIECTDLKPYLLHGDCGFHNFIFKEGCLTGVIDPTPIIGDPLYDLLYAFCSTPADLSKEIIDETVKRMSGQMSISQLYEKTLIILYFRLSSCIKHHKEDFEDYLNVWEYWKKIVR